MSEAVFWRMRPRKLIALIRQKKKKDIQHMQLLAYLIQGGTLEDAGEEEEDDGDEELIGVDRPARTGQVNWLGDGGITYGRGI